MLATAIRKLIPERFRPIGYLTEARLPIRHYPHRDPVQLDRRCRLRAVMMGDRTTRAEWKFDYHYWENDDWRSFVTPDDAPGLKYWHPGEPLEEIKQTNHLAPVSRRLLQYVVHRALVRALDQCRPGWPSEAKPQPIPNDIVTQLRSALR